MQFGAPATAGFILDAEYCQGCDAHRVAGTAEAVAVRKIAPVEGVVRHLSLVIYPHRLARCVRVNGHLTAASALLWTSASITSAPAVAAVGITTSASVAGTATCAPVPGARREIRRAVRVQHVIEVGFSRADRA
jgi:hypothetical protein